MLKIQASKIINSNVKELDVYLFDCMGLVVLRNIIPIEKIELAKNLIKKKFPGILPWKFSILSLGEVFWDIMTNPKIMAFAEQVCGDQFRLDHAFSVASDAGIVNLHGGPSSSFGSCFTKIDNQLMTGQLSCGIPLVPQSPATGGMCYIPGSHRSVDFRTGKDIRKDLFNESLEHESIIVPDLNPGDVVFFSESLVHGDKGWKITNYTRTVLYYKFCPGFMTWRDPRQQEQYVALARNPLEKKLIEPPWSGQFSDSKIVMDNVNKRRERTL